MRIEYTCEDGSRTLARWPSLALLYWLGRSLPPRFIDNPKPLKVFVGGQPVADGDHAMFVTLVLAGISDQDFLESMARSDELADHDGETCGHCHYAILGAEIAREMIEAGEYEDVVSQWAAEHKRRWEKSKFFKLWEKEKKAGRDPRKAFNERGWEP